MERPDIGIQGITIEHLNGLRDAFGCYYSHIFHAMYGVKNLDHRLINLLIWSVEKDEALPSKEDLLKYQATFDKEKEASDKINEMFLKMEREKTRKGLDKK